MNYSIFGCLLDQILQVVVLLQHFRSRRCQRYNSISGDVLGRIVRAIIEKCWGPAVGKHWRVPTTSFTLKCAGCYI